jgi:DNA-binding CsgD family transcriptional regulator
MSASAEQYSDDGVCGADEEHAVARAREVDGEFVAGRLATRPGDNCARLAGHAGRELARSTKPTHRNGRVASAGRRSKLTPAATDARRVLLERAAKRESVRELFAVASERLRRLISFQAAAWVATDPHTGLPAGQAWLENIRADDHTRVWEFEFLREDINTHRDLVTAAIPAAGLRLATSDRPARSARYREILRPNGFEDELRAVVRADGSLWASIALLRTAGMPAFDAGEIELVASLSEPLADVVREHVRESAPSSAPNDGHRAGLMVFAAGGELMSANEEARELLDELERTEHSLAPGHLCALPLPAAGALVRARAIAEEREHGPARVLTRSRAGRWIACHGSCLRDADGRLGSTALLIEPASPTEIAPVMMTAYELSGREQQITALIAHGHNTASIAHRLHLSRHTVRDYIKAILAKVDARSRGELVARLSGGVI